MTTQPRIVDKGTGEILDAAYLASEPPQEPIPAEADVVIPRGTVLVSILPGLDKAVLALSEEALKLRRYADECKVDSPETQKSVTNDLVVVGDYLKQAQEKQKEWLLPVKEAESKIRKAFELILAPLEGAKATFKAKLGNYYTQQEGIRRAEQEAADAQRRLLEAQARAKGIDVVIEMPKPATPEVAKTVRAEAGTSGVSMIRKWRWAPGLSQGQIIEKLPMAYHQANETLIGQAIRGNKGMTSADFGGTIEIYEEPSVRATGKH